MDNIKHFCLKTLYDRRIVSLGQRHLILVTSQFFFPVVSVPLLSFRLKIGTHLMILILITTTFSYILSIRLPETRIFIDARFFNECYLLTDAICVQ